MNIKTIFPSDIIGNFDVPVDNLKSFPVLISHMKRNHASFLENLVIQSPDTGGAKRAGALQERLNKDGINADLAICYKKRKKENEVEKIYIMGYVKGKNVLVVDDIYDTCGTAREAARVSKEKGAIKVYSWGTHGLFTKGLGGLKVIDKIMTSDTVYNPLDGRLEIVSLVELVGEAIYRTVMGASLSSLFES